MTDVIIASSATLWLGLFAGYLLGSRPRWVQAKEEARQREIERRLRGNDRPRHRATSEPAVIRAARVARSTVWRG